MERNIKQINIKNRSCYLFNSIINDMINIKQFDAGLLEINKLSFKGAFSINIYYITCIAMKSHNYANDSNNEDLLHLFFNNVDYYWINY